ncbi:MAG: formylglycine-generating enzyme family protein [Bacteroidia bacterium]|nr:formylglycine-generating enzyme family protein [Bacteroidia bacterium]
MKKGRLLLFLTAVVAVMFTGCGGENINFVGKESSKTGIRYNSDDGFQVKNYKGQETAPGLVFIEGGTFHMGGGEKDIAYDMDNRERQVTVHSFYMDESEVSNVDYKEFLFYILRDSGDVMYKNLYPDTTVWLKDLAYNDPYTQYYFGHDGFNMYPVVGVNWHQANEYCKWRTNIVNGKLLQDDPEAVLWPEYRLPTEAEWEYAARGMLEQELYTWEGKSLRDAQGRFRANFKRGRGDYAGRSSTGGSNLPGGLNDGYMICAPVRAFYPNDLGLYNMAGNVCEWTKDTYRVLSYEDMEDLNPHRRKGMTEIFKDPLKDDEAYDERRSLLFNPDPNKAPGNSDFDNVKVYRGGSWADIAYYLTTGSRRYLNADSSLSTVGFRCAMIRVGSPS